MKDNLTLGGVYKTEWNERPFRIIGMDNVEVLYDCLWPDDNAWTFSGNFNKKCYFYRTSKALFETKSRLLDNLPLTQQEQQAFRPDLLVRFGRTKELRWNDFKVTDYLNFVKILNNLTDKRFLDPKIDADEIVLIPYGPKGGLKKGTIIKANNSKYFECAEVIWKAKNLQESVNNHTNAGIGIYRIGFEKRLPSFYIGQYQDSAGLLTE